MMSLEIQFFHTELTLGWVDHDAMLAEPLKDQPDMTLVLFGTGAGHQKVVDVCIAER